MNAQPDYKNSPKNKQRRAWWKSVAARCAEMDLKTKDAKVLYQPGEQDHDRKIARQYGFHDYNLIGIDRDPNVCRKLRKRGVTMINCDVVEALAAWNPDNLPNVILLDTCSSISGHFSKLLSVFKGGNFYNKKLIFAFNVVHGRDGYLKPWRAACEREFPPVGEICYNVRRDLWVPISYVRGDDGRLHRGLAIAGMVKQIFLMNVMKIKDDMSEKTLDALHWASVLMDAEIGQYKSAGAAVYMDWVIFNWNMRILNNHGKEVAPKRIKGYSLRASQKIAAGLATGTIQQRKRAAA